MIVYSTQCRPCIVSLMCKYSDFVDSCVRATLKLRQPSITSVKKRPALNYILDFQAAGACRLYTTCLTT